MRTKITKEQVLEYVTATGGTGATRTIAAKRFGCSPSTTGDLLNALRKAGDLVSVYGPPIKGQSGTHPTTFYAPKFAPPAAASQLPLTVSSAAAGNGNGTKRPRTGITSLFDGLRAQVEAFVEKRVAAEVKRRMEKMQTTMRAAARP